MIYRHQTLPFLSFSLSKDRKKKATVGRMGGRSYSYRTHVVGGGAVDMTPRHKIKRCTVSLVLLGHARLRSHQYSKISTSTYEVE